MEKTDILKYLTVDMVRRYGICVSLRDLDELSSEEIFKELQKIDTEQISSLKKSIQQYKQEIKSKPEEDLKTSFNFDINYANERITAYTKSLNTYKELLTKYRAMQPLVSNEVAIGVLDGAIKEVLRKIETDESMIEMYKKDLETKYNDFSEYVKRSKTLESDFKKRQQEHLIEAEKNLANYKPYADIYKDFVEDITQAYNQVK